MPTAVRVTVISSTVFTLDGSSPASTTILGGRFMKWTAPSDCTGRQTSIDPVVVDDVTPCRPWRSFGTSEHLTIN